MTALEYRVCEACKIGSPKATTAEIANFMPQIPDWKIIEVDGIAQLSRTFEWTDFQAALAFTNRIGEIAEKARHHPAILTEWGRATVRWWTHKIKGLHVNDFIMAARTDRQAG